VAAGNRIAALSAGASRGLLDIEARAAQLTAWTPPGVTINRVGSMFTFFFTESPVNDWIQPRSAIRLASGNSFHHMLERRIYLAPSQFEADFFGRAPEDDIRQNSRGCSLSFLCLEGLCDTCVFRRVITSDKGSVFYMCERALTDPSFPK